MRKNTLQFVAFTGALVLLAILTGACTMSGETGLAAALNPTDVQAAPGQGLRLWLPKDVNSLKIGESIILAIDNESSSYILLPSDYGVHLYQYQKESGQWIEVPNKAEAFPIDSQIELPPKDSDLYSGATITVTPDVQPATEPVMVRVAVVGRVAESHNPTDQQVAAYIDFTLQP